jgi:hypothetical protein
MNNCYITTSFGFIKDIVLDKTTYTHVIEYTDKLRYARAFNAKGAKSLIAKHDIVGFIYNPYAQEAVRGYNVLRDRYADDNHTPYQNFDLILEASMLSQRLMDIGKKEILADSISQQIHIEDQNTGVWNKIPKGDDDKFWLNEYGLRIWHINEPEVKSAERSYYWCDRVLILNANHCVLDDIKFSDFIQTVENGWTPQMPEKRISHW